MYAYWPMIYTNVYCPLIYKNVYCPLIYQCLLLLLQGMTLLIFTVSLWLAQVTIWTISIINCTTKLMDLALWYFSSYHHELINIVIDNWPTYLRKVKRPFNLIIKYVRNMNIQWNLSNPTHQGTMEMCRIAQDVGKLRFSF